MKLDRGDHANTSFSTNLSEEQTPSSCAALQINVRLNGALAQQMGRSRLQVTLAKGATVSDLLAHLHSQAPLKILESAVPFVAGQHVARATPLQNGQEVALLIPIAGGK